MTGIEEPVVVELAQTVGPRHHPVVATQRRGAVKIEDVVRIVRRRRAVPDGGGDDPCVDLDPLSVRRLDERLERIETGSDTRIGHRHARAEAEAIAATNDLGDDRIGMGGPGRGDERAYLRLVVEALAERVRPERAKLPTHHRCRRDGVLRRKRSEQASQVGHQRRESDQLQVFPSPCVTSCRASYVIG